jgi:hypothetical protein
MYFSWASMDRDEGAYRFKRFKTCLESVCQAADRWYEARPGQQSPPGQRGQPTRRFKLSTLSTVYGNSEFHGENSNTVDVDAVDAGETEAPTDHGRHGLFDNYTTAGPYRDGF